MEGCTRSISARNDNLRLVERSDPEVTHASWNPMIFWACLGGKGFESRMWERFAATKVQLGEADPRNRLAHGSLSCCTRVMVCGWTVP